MTHRGEVSPGTCTPQTQRVTHPAHTARTPEVRSEWGGSPGDGTLDEYLEHMAQVTTSRLNSLRQQ